jgi:hypothetical protein
LNNKLLRVLGQLEMGDEASLVCELPNYLLNGVAVDDYGQVDLAGLLALCKQLSMEEESEFLPDFSAGFEEQFEDEFEGQMQAKAQSRLADSLTFSNSLREEEEFQKGSFWFRMIYDRSLAADPSLIRAA